MPRHNNPALAVLGASTLASTIDRAVAREEKKKARARNRSKSSPSKPAKAIVGGPRSASRGAMPSANSVLTVAPVAGGIVSRGSDWSFGAAQPERGLRGIRIHGRQIWATANTSAQGSINDNTTILPFGVATSQTVLTFDPDDTKTMPPPMTSLSQVFSRYVLRAAKVIYTPTPANGTSNGTTIAMAVITDAAYAASIQHTSPSIVVNAYAVAQNSNSVMGPVWQPMELNVPCDGTLRFTYQSATDISTSSAEQRQDHAFALVSAIQNPVATQSGWGFFHLEYSIDLYEVVVSSNETALLRKVREGREAERELLRRQEVRVERKEATPVRDEEKKSISSSPEVSPQESLSGGWIRAPSLREWREPSATLTREGQAAGLVKSQSHKA
jgi:hypothetical protein